MGRVRNGSQRFRKVQGGSQSSGKVQGWIPKLREGSGSSPGAAARSLCCPSWKRRCCSSFQTGFQTKILLGIVQGLGAGNSRVLLVGAAHCFWGLINPAFPWKTWNPFPAQLLSSEMGAPKPTLLRLPELKKMGITQRMRPKSMEFCQSGVGCQGRVLPEFHLAQ